MNNKKIIILTGHTASGKSDIGLELLNTVKDAIVINIDSMQVYKHNKILSAQPEKREDHVLYGFLSDDSRFSVFEMLSLIKQEIDKNEYRAYIIIGGSPLYIRLFLDGINETELVRKDEKIVSEKYDLDKELIYNEILEHNFEAGRKISINDKFRVVKAFLKIKKEKEGAVVKNIKFIPENYDIYRFLLYREREILYKNAEIRFNKMVENGAIEEVKNYINTYCGLDYKNFQSFKTIGFIEILSYLNNEISKQELLETGTRRTRNYIKHQDTWYKNKFNDFIKILNIEDIINRVNL